MAELKNEVTWSLSRGTIYHECLRKYYYRYYVYWGGWLRTAPNESKTAYQLSKITTIPAFVGSTVHARVREILVRCAQGGAPGFDEAKVRAYIEWAFDASENKLWRRNAKEYPCFHEHYFLRRVSEEQREAAISQTIACLREFCGSTVLRGLLRHGQDIRWLDLDQGGGIETFPLRDAKVIAVPDLVCRRGDRFLLFDWKTSANIESARSQLACYSLYTQSKWSCGARDMLGHAVVLHPEYAIERHTFDEAELVAMADLITSEYERMCELKGAGDAGEVSAFPRTKDLSCCHRCSFAPLCD